MASFSFASVAYSLAFSLMVFMVMSVTATGKEPAGTAATAATAATVFDITKYGAKADGKTDSKKAFTDAWKACCAYKGPATLAVPAGEFMLGPVTFEGPCTNNVGFTTVDIKGTLLASKDIRAYNNWGWIEFNNLHEVKIGGGGTLDGQGAEAWKLKSGKCPAGINCRNLPTSLRFNVVNNATVSNLKILNSKGFHINLHQSANVNIEGLTITAPGDSPNTDGIHIGATNNVNITDVHIGTGDDCISIGPGTSNINIFKVTCGPGHGLSVGSLGKYKNEQNVKGLTVKNCTLTGTTNGLRIKTWPGSPESQAQSMHFEDVIVSKVSNPIIIDQQYCPDSSCKDRNAPSGVKLADITFTNIKGTTDSPIPVSLICSSTKPCDGVKLTDIKFSHVDGSTLKAACTNVKATFSGEQVPPACK